MKTRTCTVSSCYSSDQRTRPGSKYLQYYHDEEIQPDKPIQVQEIFMTSRILHATVVDVLPKSIRNMFSYFNDDPDYIFLRKGVNRSSSLFIEAVMVAKGLIKGSEMDMAQRIKEQQFRKYTREFATAAKQEMYDVSIESVMNTVKNHEMRADSFVHMVEEAFHVDIIMFSKDKFLITNMLITRDRKSVV